MTIRLETAKDRSLKRWRKILADFPNINTQPGGHPAEDIYGDCSFCQKYITPCCLCEWCPLFSNKICYHHEDESTLYWRIVDRLQAGKFDAKLKAMIEQMIKAIEEVEA